jgi:aryl-alcohol dehydrogenase-like predicted oxidoreductase
MKYRRLGRTGLKVAEVCLGTMQWGWTTDAATGMQVMDAYLEAGGNFIDTADIYSSWAKDNPGGVSERVIGEWMSKRGNRDQIVLATKVRGRMWDGPNGEGLSRVHILRACEESLRRLQTDHIDLYQTHWPDDETPIDETMEALTSLVRQGKVRYLGCSNFSAWQLTQALWASAKAGLSHFDSVQPHYNLLHRAEYERELREACAHFGVGVIPYSPLAAGFLTGKYSKDEQNDSQRASGIKRRYFNDAGWRALDEVRAVAAESGATPTAVALAWLLAQPGMTAPIVGANSVDQLRESLAACEVTLSADQLDRLNRATAWQDESDD